jgi:hypothetical protein
MLDEILYWLENFVKNYKLFIFICLVIVTLLFLFFALYFNAAIYLPITITLGFFCLIFFATYNSI